MPTLPNRRSAPRRTPPLAAVDGPLESLTAQAYRTLRSEILTTRARPGTAVSEGALAAAHGFGKAPIRLALARLSQEGLVQSQPRRGYVVAPVTLRDVKDVFELRLILEPAAARLAAGQADIAALRRLDEVCAASYRPEDPDSALAFLEANRAFHVRSRRSAATGG